MAQAHPEPRTVPASCPGQGNTCRGPSSLTRPSTSRGSLEFMRTGLTLSPDSRPFTGRRLSKISSNLVFSSTWLHRKGQSESTRASSGPKLKEGGRAAPGPWRGA